MPVAGAGALLPLVAGVLASPVFEGADAVLLPLVACGSVSSDGVEDVPFRPAAFNLMPSSCCAAAGTVVLALDVFKPPVFSPTKSAFPEMETAGTLLPRGAFGFALLESAVAALAVELLLGVAVGVEGEPASVLDWPFGNLVCKALPLVGLGPGPGICGEFADTVAGLGVLVVASSKAANGGESACCPGIGACCCHCGDTIDGAALTSDAILDTAGTLIKRGRVPCLQPAGQHGIHDKPHEFNMLGVPIEGGTRQSLRPLGNFCRP